MAPPPPLNPGNFIGPYSMTLCDRCSTKNCVYFTEFGEREQEEIVRLEGIVQRKLRWVEIGINQQVLL
jgi:hypothetical protein